MYFNVFKGCGVESKMKEFQKHRANLLKRQNETLPIMLMFIGLKNEKKKLSTDQHSSAHLPRVTVLFFEYICICA